MILVALKSIKINYANGKGFENIHQQIGVMDIEIPATNKQLLIVDKWKKSSIIKMQSIESAGYECEVNPTLLYLYGIEKSCSNRSGSNYPIRT